MEVEVDLSMPPTKGDAGDESAALVELHGDLFVATALSRPARLVKPQRCLALVWLSLYAVPASPARLVGLRSLSLSQADVTDEALSTPHALGGARQAACGGGACRRARYEMCARGWVHCQRVPWSCGCCNNVHE